MKIHSSMIRKCWNTFRTILAAWHIRLIKTSPLQNKLELGQIKNILIIRLDKVGDLILSTPVFENLKIDLPGAKITVLVRSYNAGVLKNNPFVDEVLIYDKMNDRKKVQNGGFDMAVNLIYDFNLESALVCYNSGAVWRIGYKDKYTKYFYNIEIERDPLPKYELKRNLDILKQLGMKVHSENSRIFPAPEEKKECMEYVRSLKLGEKDLLIGLNPGTGRKRREWPLEKFIELGKKLVLEKNAKILVFWGDKDKVIAQKIVKNIGEGSYMATGTNITRLAALLTLCKVFVCGNTGPSHVAMAMKVPLVGLYGKDDHLNWTPEEKSKIAVVSADKCSSISVLEVIKGIEKLL